MTPRRSVYGDQGQEVAWEVSREQFITEQHEEEDDPRQVPRAIGRRRGRIVDAECGRRTLDVEPQRQFSIYKTWFQHELHS